MTEPLMTTAEVARRCTVSPDTVRAWCDAGLEHIRVGRVIRIAPAALEAWLDEHRRTQEPAAPLQLARARAPKRRRARGCKGWDDVRAEVQAALKRRDGGA